MELSVGELAIILDQSQPRVSRHVRILADAGVIERRREGGWVFLTIASAERTEPMFALVDAWADAPSDEYIRSDASKLDRVRTDRAEAAGRYFSSHADTWIRSDRCMSPRARSSRRSGARSTTSRSGGSSTSAPAPVG